MSDVNFPAMIWHRAWGLMFSVRGIIAVLFSIWMVMAATYFSDAFMAEGSVVGELLNIFADNEVYKFQWFFFDNALSKLVTIFIGPIMVFDAVSGDKIGERMGIILSRPISRQQYMLLNLLSGIVAFSIIFLGVLIPSYFLFEANIEGLTAGAYFGTTVLMLLLGWVSISVVLLISTISKNNLISFLTAFGAMSFFMLPNASKYTADVFESLAKATPHYYATYFTVNEMQGGLYVMHLILILLFAIPFVCLAIYKFKNEDL